MAIIGAGAAGLTAAIFAAESAARPLRIVLLDGAKKLGAKILVAGGGRCNVTHDRVSPDDYHGPRPVIRNVLRSFDEQAAARWFESLGIRLKREETGKLFPTTDDAQTVLSALLNRCEQLGVEILTDHRVSRIEKAARGFAIHHAHGPLAAARVILATGGKSLPRTGSDGGGYALAASLGHTVTPTFPALVPLVLAEDFFHAQLSGISHPAELSTFVGGKRIDRRGGALLWTHFGVSGPVVLDASRFWIIAHARGASPELRVSFLPGETFENVERWLLDAPPRRSVENVLADRLPARVAKLLSPPVSAGQMTREARRSLVHTLTDLKLPVVRDRGWNYAEVTAGGVPLSEVDHRTMASRRTPGLHLVGEILDVDGRIGGFNFQWAWATGYLAGRAAVF